MTVIGPALSFQYRSQDRQDINKIKQPSDLVADGASLLIVSDEKPSLISIAPGREPLEVTLPGLPSDADLEGVALDPSTRRLYVSCERPGLIYSFSFDGTVATPLASIQVPSELRTDPNKGIEGLAFLSAAQSPDGKAHLLAVHEAKPRLILAFDPTTLELTDSIDLPLGAKGILADLSGAGIDPQSGALYVVSQQTGRVAAFTLASGTSGLSVRFAGEVKLGDFQGNTKRLEGIAFDSKGDLFLQSENKRRIYHLSR